MEDIFYSQWYHSRNVITTHHGKSLSRRSLPIRKYSSCGSNTEYLNVIQVGRKHMVSQDRSHNDVKVCTIISLNSGNNQRFSNVLVELIGRFFSSEHSVCKQQRLKVNVNCTTFLLL